MNILSSASLSFTPHAPPLRGCTANQSRSVKNMVSWAPVLYANTGGWDTVVPPVGPATTRPLCEAFLAPVVVSLNSCVSSAKAVAARTVRQARNFIVMNRMRCDMIENSHGGDKTFIFQGLRSEIGMRRVRCGWRSWPHGTKIEFMLGDRDGS